jgi:nitronate monooxygenase
MLTTALTDRFALRYPILNAPMTPAAGGALARAVSDAGALGFLGVDVNGDVATLRADVATAREGDPQRAFGIGFLIWVLDRRPDLLAAAIDLRPALVSISFGDPTPYVEPLHRAGIAVASQVQSREAALRAQAAGVDLIVAQGTEAGGHTGQIATLPLLQIVLDLVDDRPVLAAGGIGGPRGVAAALAAGAAGVWMGTPFLLAQEARVTDEARRTLIASTEGDTVLTSVFDRAQGYAWPAQFPGRALRNAFTERWHGHEDELVATPEAIAAYEAAKRERDYRLAHVYAGESVGLQSRIRPAAEIVRAIGDGAEALLRDRFAALLG